MSNPVSAKWYSSDMGGAQALTGAIGGGIIALLHACLVTGFGSVTLSSLTITSGIATATVNTGHGFLDYQVVLIAGATPSGLNGDKRITRTGTNTFTFDATGIADGIATGTITAKTSPAGWTMPLTGTNLAAFAKAVGGTQHLLRVDDTAVTWAALNLYKTMGDINTGTDVAPSSGSLYHHKSTDNSTPRAWRLYADPYAFYLFSQGNGTDWFGRTFFGDIVTSSVGDQYHCALISHPNDKDINYFSSIVNITAGHVLARAYDQITVAPVFGKTAGYRSGIAGTYGGGGPFTFPDAMTRMGLIEKMQCWESAAFRGLMPGLYNIAHSGAVQFVPVYGSGDLVGRRLIFQPMYSNSGSTNQNMAIDITGPWR